MAGARDRDERRAVEEQVCRLVAVPPGDHDDVGAERVRAARELLAVERRIAHEDARLEQVRRRNGRPRQQQLAKGILRILVQQARPDSATITGSSTTGVPAGSSSRAWATASVARLDPTIPIFTASTPRSCATTRTCSRMNSGGTGWTPVTARVFCAVSAVSAVVPCTPAWANALRSAWMPAPPPESEPAIERHTGTRSAMRPMIGREYDRLTMDDGAIHYTTSADGTSIAWRRFGDGDVDVIWLGGFVGHLEYILEQPLVQRFFDRVGAFARVVAFDKRGQGLSDRPDRAATMEEHAEDALAVMDAAGLERPRSSVSPRAAPPRSCSQPRIRTASASSCCTARTPACSATTTTPTAQRLRDWTASASGR